MELAKEVQEILLSRTLNISAFCRKHNISAPTVKKVIDGEKVSDGTLYKLKSILQ